MITRLGCRQQRCELFYAGGRGGSSSLGVLGALIRLLQGGGRGACGCGLSSLLHLPAR